MTKEQRLQNLTAPEGRVDAVLDTDAFNEVDDQFAISYMLRSTEKICTKAIYAAPFFNSNSESAADGMEKSYQEIFRLLALLQEEKEVYRGSESYLPDEKTAVESPAARDLAARAKSYSPEHPLYVIAIGAITNIASALLLDPSIAENIVVVWLGGHARHYKDTYEFNLYQDIAAARVVMNSGAPFVQLPCMGVVDKFYVNAPMLNTWFKGKNELCDFLAEKVERYCKERKYAGGEFWSKVIWDVTAVAWLTSPKMMRSRIVPVRLPGYDHQYETAEQPTEMTYVYNIEVSRLMQDMVKKLTK